MSNRVPVLACALVLALAAAACGSSDPSPSPAASAAPSASRAPAPSPSPAESGPATSASPASSSGAGQPELVCSAPATPTTPQTEGPYYTPGAPEKADLIEEGMPGTPLLVTGFVVDTSCSPLAGVKVDVWQADANGEYDNSGGYRLRGYVLTDADGRYSFRTVVPGEYPGRTEHIHVKITRAGGETLTSQLYFPGSTANEGDNIFSPDLLLSLDERPDGLTGTFTFVVEG